MYVCLSVTLPARAPALERRLASFFCFVCSVLLHQHCVLSVCLSVCLLSVCTLLLHVDSEIISFICSNNDTRLKFTLLTHLPAYLAVSQSVGLFPPPPPQPHPLLNSHPNPLYDLPIPPPSSTINSPLLIPPLHRKTLHPASPTPHFPRRLLPSPPYIDARSMLEQFRRRRPLIRLELPGLAGREHGHQSLPVIRFEVRGRVDEDESGGFSRSESSPYSPSSSSSWASAGDGGVGCPVSEWAGDVEKNVRGRGHSQRGMVGRDKHPVPKERFHVRHPD